MKRYEYLVSYIHQYGHGRIFITRDTTIGSGDDIVEIEKVIANVNDARMVGVNNFQLLRTFKDQDND